MKKCKLEITGLTYSQTQSGAYALVLGEVDGQRRLPIIIGGFEAQAIAIEMEKMTPSRPLTHDLFKSFAQQFHVKIVEVLIYNLVDGIFYAKIICDHSGKLVEIDARTSDAIAIAVRFQSPIYTYAFILDAAGLVIEENDLVFLENMEAGDTDKSDQPIAYSKQSDAELKDLLQSALDEEAYEKAAKIRDEIARRKAS